MESPKQNVLPLRGGYVNQSIPGVIFASGRNWVDMRRFTLHTLRDFGFGKQGMEEMIQEEVEMLCQFLEKEQGKPVNIKYTYNIAILNALWRVLTGERLSYTDARLTQIVSLMDQLFKQFTSPLTQIALTMPWLNALMELVWPSYKPRPTLQKVFDVIEEVVGNHKKTLQEDSPRDFIDTYLTQQNAASKYDPASSFGGRNGDINLRSAMLDLFLAGMETTSTTLNWTTLFMAKYPGNLLLAQNFPSNDHVLIFRHSKESQVRD